MNKTKLKKLLTNRIFLHILFWCLSFFVFTRTFKVSADVQKIDYIYSGLFHISLVTTVYINLFILIPYYLGRNRYFIYVTGLILTVVFSVNLNIITFEYLADLILPGYYFISYYEFFDIAKFLVVYITITSLLKLSKSWFHIQEVKQQLTQLEKENIDSELKALKAQINPHFLFNSLNVLYSLALKESAKTPGAIIQLSDILRYVIYDSSKENVTLKDEIRLIKDYIELQKFRIDKSSKVAFIHNVENSKKEIAPMLFLPLIENSFKHGLKGNIKDTFLDINLTSDKNSVIFNIENNSSGSGNNKDEQSGIGLKNIKSRLELIYPEKHSFKINDSGNTFSAELRITQ